MKTTLRDRWLDFWHALPPFRGRLAIARVVAQHLMTTRRTSVAWAKLPNGLRLKVDVRWRGGYDNLYYFRTYEPSLTSLIRASLEIDGAAFIDVGANIGAFCLLAADVLQRRHGRALAAEPLPQNLAFLQESIATNGLSALIEVAPYAVGDSEGVLALEVMAPGDIANARPTTWSQATSDAATIVSVPMTTLDLLTRDWRLSPSSNVQFVKIDVEGAELFVLRGSSELLRRERPLVYCEFHREFMAANGTTFPAIESFAASLDYVIHYLGRNGRIVRSHPDPHGRYLDLVLVPRHATPHQRALIEA
ncbi:MAG TPA: FkbM family methyltransferase [Thermoanaerobaculia bacterium]|jgi:FkbM family methyltransferase